MFRQAAGGLPSYSNGEPFWPAYALLTHAIELSLKAFFRYSTDKGKPPPRRSRITTIWKDGIDPVRGLFLSSPHFQQHGARDRSKAPRSDVRAGRKKAQNQAQCAVALPD